MDRALASCGTSGGDDSSSDEKATTTAAASDDDAGDDADDADDPTTTAADSGDDTGDLPSSAALADILPTVDDVPAGYEVDSEDLTDEDEGSEDDDEEEDDESDPTGDAIIEACPGAQILEDLDNGEASPAEVSREFSTEVDQTLEIALDPTPTDFTEEKVEQVVEALADCGTIETTDEDGNAISMDISAELNDEYGDYGMTMSMDASFEFMGTALEIEFRGVVFNTNGVTVSVVATSGLDEATFELVPGDYDAVPELAGMMQERVESL